MTSAATKEPRSAAARRAAGETGPPPSPPTDEADGGQADRPDPEAVREREDLELAREEARLAREETQQMRAELERVRAESAAAADVADPEPGSAASTSPAVPASVVPHGRDDGQITPEERAMVLRVREARKREILEGIQKAPRRVGIDLDQFTLVHLRGCPNSERTETYEARNTSTGEEFTIHRCIECGAHLPIPH